MNLSSSSLLHTAFGVFGMNFDIVFGIVTASMKGKTVWLRTKRSSACHHSLVNLRSNWSPSFRIRTFPRTTRSVVCFFFATYKAQTSDVKKRRRVADSFRDSYAQIASAIARNCVRHKTMVEKVEKVGHGNEYRFFRPFAGRIIPCHVCDSVLVVPVQPVQGQNANQSIENRIRFRETHVPSSSLWLERFIVAIGPSVDLSLCMKAVFFTFGTIM